MTKNIWVEDSSLEDGWPGVRDSDLLAQRQINGRSCTLLRYSRRVRYVCKVLRRAVNHKSWLSEASDE